MHGGVNAKRNMQRKHWWASVAKTNGKYSLAFKGIFHLIWTKHWSYGQDPALISLALELKVKRYVDAVFALFHSEPQLQPVLNLCSLKLVSRTDLKTYIRETEINRKEELLWGSDAQSQEMKSFTYL